MPARFPVIYVAHPLAAPTSEERQRNRANAARWVAWVAAQGYAPVATWITLSGQWEETEESREFGLLIDCTLVERCDAVWLVGGRISSGMRREADHALAHGIPVVDLTHYGALPPQVGRILISLGEQAERGQKQ